MMTLEHGRSSPGLASGTLVRTPSGDVAVEALRVGDVVATMSGTKRQIRWIGQRRMTRATSDEFDAAKPVRVTREAFGTALPERDLVLAPGHAILVTCVDEVLIPIGAFVNGSTVAVIDDVDEVTYWEVELERHDVLFANGLPCESHMRAVSATPCRPYCTDPVVVDALRGRLHQRAYEIGWTAGSVDPDLRLEVDGQVVRPDVVANRARFIIPAAAKEVWLVSRSFVPRDVMATLDTRSLGVQIMSVAVDDGIDVQRSVCADDPRFEQGFYGAETNDDGTFRWTEGRARLPADLWEGCQGQLFLKLDFSARHLMGWSAPTTPLSPADLPGSIGMRLPVNAA